MAIALGLVFDVFVSRDFICFCGEANYFFGNVCWPALVVFFHRIYKGEEGSKMKKTMLINS